MKNIIICLLLIFTIDSAFAQKTNKPIGIISTTASVKKFHEKSELESMPKGPLLELYIERIKVLVNTLPYIALTTKAGVTMEDVGIPSTSENVKSLENQKLSTAQYLAASVDFQKSMTPYADKGNLIISILYYESMLKELTRLYE